MFDAILNLPVAAGVLIFTGATWIMAFVPYISLRMAFARREDGGATDFAGSVVFRISALHGLILALVFAQELVNVRDIATAASREAVLSGDVFYDLRRYDDAGTVALRREVARYVDTVLNEEWDRLANDRALSDTAWQAWETAYGGILALDPQSPAQEALKRIMVADIREISGLRRIRENAGLAGVSGLFVVAAVVGVMLTSAGFFIHPVTAPNMVLLSIYALYTGLVIYFIVAFANPYDSPGTVPPLGFEQIFAGEIRSLALEARTP